MKRVLSFFFAIMLIFSMFASIAVSAYAANLCKPVKGTSAKTVTFTVKTGSRVCGANRIILTPSKGVINTTNKFTGRRSTSKQYGFYQVYITDKKTGRTTWLSLYGKKLTIPLDPNRTYTIKIVPNNESLKWQMSILNIWEYGSWKKNASWSVTRTYGITACG